MLINIVLRCPAVAGRTSVASRLLQQPARFRVNRARKFDGLLRRYYSENERRTSHHEMPAATKPLDAAQPPKCNLPSAAAGSAAPTGCAGKTGSDGSDGAGGSNRNLVMLLAAAGFLVGGYGAYLWLSGDSDDDSKPASAKKQIDSKSSKSRVPANAADIPAHVPYLLIGGGTASFAAFRAIKSADPKAKVLVVTDEIEMPYMRPPLSKEMWSSAAPPNESGVPATINETHNFKQWNGKERSLFFEPAAFYQDPATLMASANGGVAIVRGYTVRHIDVCTRTAVLSDGTEIKYDECLLATGSQPRNLDVFAAAPTAVKQRVSLFKTVQDFERLRDAVGNSCTVAVIGGGFLGSELSCALAKYGRTRDLKVYQVFRESGNMGRVLPGYLSEWTANRVREEGVQVVAGTQVESVSMQGDRVRLRLMNGQDLLVDRVIVAAGSQPDTSLAVSSGLEVDEQLGGYVVNAELEARRHLYVAGDAACFYDTKLGRRRVEHHDHAVVSGRLAGENMVGQKKPYKHQSMFWSDIGPKVGFEAIGIVDARLPTVGVFAAATERDTPAAAQTDNLVTDRVPTNAADSTAVLLDAQQGLLPAKSRVVDAAAASKAVDGEPERYGKGVLFYLRDEKVVGVVLWNVFNRINTARAIVNEHKKWDDLNELAKLFEIHS